MLYSFANLSQCNYMRKRSNRLINRQHDDSATTRGTSCFALALRAGEMNPPNCEPLVIRSGLVWWYSWLHYRAQPSRQNMLRQTSLSQSGCCVSNRYACTCELNL